jgi:hypothetical protein
MLGVEAPPSAEEEQAERSQEEEDREERVPLNPEEQEDVEETRNELHFAPVPAHPYAGPDQVGILDE